jgi:hypothetical protein
MRDLTFSHHSLQLHIYTIHGFHKLVLMHPTWGQILARLTREVLYKISPLYLHRLCHHQSHQFQIHFPSLNYCMNLVRLLFSDWSFFNYLLRIELPFFSDVKPFIRAAEMPSWVFMYKAGSLLINDRIHFLLPDYLSWLNECFKLFIIADWNAYVLMSLPTLSSFRSHAVRHKCFFKLEHVFLGGYVLPSRASQTDLSHASPEFLLAQRCVLELSNYQIRKTMGISYEKLATLSCK